MIFSIRYVLAAVASIVSVSLPAQVLTPSAFGQLLDEQYALVYCIGKDYAYTGMQAEPIRAKREQDSCIARFEANYQQLTASPLATGSLARTLTKVSDAWTHYQQAAQGPADPEAGVAFRHTADQLILAIRAVESALQTSAAAKKEGYGEKVVDPLIRTSSKLVTLAQAMAMDYAFCAWKLPEDVHCASLVLHEQEFSEALYQLLTTTANDQRIEDEISVIAKYWKAMKTLHHKTGQPSLNEAFSLASILSLQSSKVTALYLAMAR